MTPSAPASPHPAPSARPRKRVLAIALLAGISCLGVATNANALSAWSRNLTSDAGGDFYPSAEFMAEHVGCQDTFHPAHLPGTSASAGECDLPDGAHIEFRTFATSQEPFAWLDGARGQSGRLEEAGAGGVGANWAIRVTGTTDRAVMDTIFQSLPS